MTAFYILYARDGKGDSMRLIDADELEEEICKQYRHFSQRIVISPVFEAIKKAPSLNLSDAVIAEVMQMDDLISRQAVLSLAKDVTLEGGAKHRCVDATEICLLPTAQPEQWIPVTERLPENDDEVLVTVEFKKHRFVHTASYSVDVDGDPQWCSLWDEYRIRGQREKIVAWMPMPKPYKG